MKILMILSKEFVVDPRVYKEAKSLVEAGHQVTVLVWNRKGEYESESTIEGIKVIRLRNTSFMKFLPNDLIRNPFWWRMAYKKAVELFKKDFRFDVVHCHDLDTLKTGVWLKKKLGIKLIYDSHEIFIYMIEQNTFKFIVNFARYMEKRSIKNADHIITVDEGYADYFHPITKKPLSIVRNCKDLIGEYTPPTKKNFTLIYIGTVNRMRFFPQLLQVVGKLTDVQLIIIAKKEDSIYTEIKQLAKKFNNILFLDPIPTTKVLKFTQEAHAIACLFDPSIRLNRIGSPNKLFEAMVTGRPIIVTKGTHAGDIVEKEHCGLAVDYSEKGLKEAILLLRDNHKLCEELGRNGISAAEREYNWAIQQKNLLKVYDNIKENAH
jgi:glycosyltransferase involved in cell wall biosynthesis